MDRIFGTVIRQIREKQHLSQAEAARISGVSQSVWSRLEDGTSWPRKRTIVSVCKGLEVSMQDFFLKLATHIQSLEPWGWSEWNGDDER